MPSPVTISSALIDAAYALIASNGSTRSGRKIANTIVPDVVIEEIITDTVRVTDHPVEIGAAVSDHAFKLPTEIVMRCGFSDSTGMYEGYSRMAWQYFIELQNKREPFDIVTPKRSYQNMLVSFLNVTEDEETSHALRINIGFRQVLITSTTLTPGQQSTGMIGLNTNPSAPAFTQLFPGLPTGIGIPQSPIPGLPSFLQPGATQ